MKYNKDLIIRFLAACKAGLTPTQIASDWGILVEELQTWSSDPKYKKTWLLGKEAFQAYHETLLARMTDKTRDDYLPKVSNAELSAQQYRLKVLFKEQWSEKAEPIQIVTNNFSNMSEADIDKHLTSQIHRLMKNKPDLQINITKENKDLH